MAIYGKINYNMYKHIIVYFLWLFKKTVYKGGKNVIEEYDKKIQQLTVRLTEEIDQHCADKIRREIDNEIERYSPRKVIFDFNNISFMDSSGIGMVLGRFKLIKMLDGNLELINLNKNMKRIFDMSGVSKIIKVSEVKEEKSVGNK